MTIVAPEITKFLSIPIPGENSDPFMNQFRNYTNKIEEIMLFNKLFNNLYITGGGTRTWVGASGILTWTDDWVIPVFHYGKKILVQYGNDDLTRAVTLQDGQALIVTVPASLSVNRTVNFDVLDQLDTTKNDQWVAGWRNDTTLQMRGIGEIT